MSIYEKLLLIQSELKAPKSQYNSFGKYNYRNCEDILEAFKPLGAKYNAAVMISDEIVLIGERYYVKATAKLIDTENGASIENIAFAREEEKKAGMDSSQITGSCSSYARKYALNGLFAIDDTKDSDTTNTGENGKKTPKTGNKQTKQHSPREKLIAKLEENGIDFKEYAAEKGLTKETPPERFDELLKEFK